MRVLWCFFSIHFAVRFYCTKMFQSHRNKEFSSDENTTKVSVRSRCQCCNLTLVLQRQTVLFLLSQPVEKVDCFCCRFYSFPSTQSLLGQLDRNWLGLHFSTVATHIWHASYPVTHQNAVMQSFLFGAATWRNEFQTRRQSRNPREQFACFVRHNNSGATATWETLQFSPTWQAVFSPLQTSPPQLGGD